ncbi:hypothetical protein EON81_05245 [bacterium]|nr:MAG: hypothetical protein EON81_05245 [bacterium]
MRRFKDQFMSDEGNFLAAGIAWTSALAWFTFLGFVMGQIIGSDHVQDLQMQDMANGLKGGAVGLVVGIAVALAVTFYYPKYTKREAEEEARGINHHN